MNLLGVHRGNRIHALLQSLDAPWRLARTELAAQGHGRTDPAYEWPVLDLPTRQPIVKDLIRPLCAQAFPEISPLFPPLSLSAASWRGDDARKNVRRAATELERALGRARIAVQHNVVRCEWRQGAASLRLTGWPEDLQPQLYRARIPAHARDPRLSTACHINIHTGLRPVPTPQERDWLDSFRPLASMTLPVELTAETVKQAQAHETQLEFVREPGPEWRRVFGKIGLSADGAAVIFGAAQLHLVPIDHVIELSLDRLLPARGPGRSSMSLRCRPRFDGGPAKYLEVCVGNGPDHLTPLAEQLASALDRPLKLSPYEYNA